VIFAPHVLLYNTGKMNTVKKLFAGNQFTKSRLHDLKGNLIDLEGLLYLPHSLLTTIMRLSGGRRPKLPWLGYRAIRHLDGLLNPDWKMLEFGSGMSTMWFAKRCHRVVSVEDNELWYLKVKKMLEEHGVTNVEYKFKSTNEYHILDEYTEGYFDFILIDGVQRDKCARSALPKIREGGYIYLDNTDQRDHPNGNEVRIAEETLLNAAKEKGGQVKYFVNLIPTYVAVTQGMLVKL
jgi:hypothetical protein